MAFLHTFRTERGLSTTFTVDVPEQGITAMELARAAGLPTDIVEGVFLNGRKQGAGAIVRPGDRVMFVPYGTPASHPAFFGGFDE